MYMLNSEVSEDDIKESERDAKEYIKDPKWCMSCNDKLFLPEDIHHITGIFLGEINKDINLCEECYNKQVGSMPIIKRLL